MNRHRKTRLILGFVDTGRAIGQGLLGIALGALMGALLGWVVADWMFPRF